MKLSSGLSTKVLWLLSLCLFTSLYSVLMSLISATCVASQLVRWGFFIKLRQSDSTVVELGNTLCVCVCVGFRGRCLTLKRRTKFCLLQMVKISLFTCRTHEKGLRCGNAPQNKTKQNKSIKLAKSGEVCHLSPSIPFETEGKITS